MLTAKQHELLRFIERYQRAEGYTPNFREMMEAVGLRSTAGVFRLITALEERGFIRRLPNRARAIEIVRSSLFDDEVFPAEPVAANSATTQYDAAALSTELYTDLEALRLKLRQFSGRVSAINPHFDEMEFDKHSSECLDGMRDDLMRLLGAADEELEAAEAADGLEPGQVAWPRRRFYFTDAAE